jgi:hypothetical protein
MATSIINYDMSKIIQITASTLPLRYAIWDWQFCTFNSLGTWTMWDSNTTSIPIPTQRIAWILGPIPTLKSLTRFWYHVKYNIGPENSNKFVFFFL